MAREPCSKMGASSCWPGATSLCLVLAGTPSFQSLLHEGVDRRADGAEVVLLELLALNRLAAKERAATHDEVRALLEVLLLDEEVLLLGADGGHDVLGGTAEELQHALGLALKSHLGAQQRGLLVKRLAGIGDEGCGDA